MIRTSYNIYVSPIAVSIKLKKSFNEFIFSVTEINNFKQKYYFSFTLEVLLFHYIFYYILLFQLYINLSVLSLWFTCIIPYMTVSLPHPHTWHMVFTRIK